MKNLKTYLFNAFYMFLDENGHSPQIFITNRDGLCKIPANLGFEEVLLNVKSESISNLFIDDEGMSFVTRFNGVQTSIFIPINNILYIQSKDKKFMFPVSIEFEESTSEIKEESLPKIDNDSIIPKQKHVLRLVSSGGISNSIPQGKLSLVNNENY